MNETPTKFDEWCVVELMGHQKIVGHCTEAALAGGAFLRVDVPEVQGKPAFTRFFGSSAIYSINPTTEELARKMVAAYRNEPVSRFDLPAIAEKVPITEAEEVDDDPNVDYCPDCKNEVMHCVCEEDES